MSLEVSCPKCKKKFIYSTENKYRPFCSERCKLIDLGQWANNEYQIEVPPETEEDFAMIISALEQKHGEK